MSQAEMSSSQITEMMSTEFTKDGKYYVECDLLTAVVLIRFIELTTDVMYKQCLLKIENETGFVELMSIMLS